MQIEVELFQVIITEGQPQQTIVLREKGGERFFPIFIGYNEALAIDRKVKDVPIPRPLTHDLLHSVVAALGAKLVRVVINDLKDETYYALLEFRRGAEVLQVDSRPSDAIALAVRAAAPIFVEEHVFMAASQASLKVAEQTPRAALCILKDGRRIRAIQISDEGSEYAITDENGQLITVKKSDVIKIVEE
jgi:bifunctional DNase/RNase